MSKWIGMKVVGRATILSLLESKLAATLDIILDQAQNDGRWESTPTNRTYIIEQTQLSMPTYFRYVNKLVQKQILLKGNIKGIYYINQDMVRI